MIQEITLVSQQMSINSLPVEKTRQFATIECDENDVVIKNKKRRVAVDIYSDRFRTESTNSSNLVELGSTQPSKFLKSMLSGKCLDIVDEQSFFLMPSEKQLDSYDQLSVAAVRAQDTSTLNDMHKSGKDLYACNRFGESLLHMACRRGFIKVVDFLVRKVAVPTRIRDDYGRTVLHDACWTPEPNFEMMDILLNEEPRLLFVTDKRGHQPLDYVRREHWRIWNEYLIQKQTFLQQVLALHCKK